MSSDTLNIFLWSTRAGSKGHRPRDIVMKKGLKDHHVAFVTARSSAIVGSILKNRVFY